MEYKQFYIYIIVNNGYKYYNYKCKISKIIENAILYEKYAKKLRKVSTIIWIKLNER